MMLEEYYLIHYTVDKREDVHTGVRDVLKIRREPANYHTDVLNGVNHFVTSHKIRPGAREIYVTVREYWDESPGRWYANRTPAECVSDIKIFYNYNDLVEDARWRFLNSNSAGLFYSDNPENDYNEYINKQILYTSHDFDQSVDWWEKITF